MQSFDKTFLNFFLAISLTCLISLPVFPSKSLLPDSTFSDESNVKRLYQIRILLIEQFVRQQSKPEHQSLVDEISALQKETVALAEQQKYQFALLLLDEIDDLISLFSSSNVEYTQLETVEETTGMKWEPEMLVGLDSWQQKFELNYGDGDTVLSENSMNPFAAVRLDFNYDRSQFMALTGSTLLKKSRDYFTATQNFNFNKTTSSTTEFEIDNYLDWTHFTHSDYVSYFYNKLSAGIFFKPNSRLHFNLSDEFRFRNYDTQQYYYASYSQNEIKFSFDAYFATQQKAGFAIRLRQRRYNDFSDKNFDKLIFNFNSDFSFSNHSSLRIYNDLALKNYAVPPADTLFQSDYIENWLTTNLKIRFNSLLSIELNDNLTIRNYKSEFDYLRDNFVNDLEGIVQLNFTPNLTFRAGYFYGLSNHRNGTDSEDVSAQVEDYFSHGPVFSLDYFLDHRLMISLSNFTRIQIYPNAENVENLTLYSDRRLNSIFLLISWEMSQHWNMNLVTNYDNERDQENDNSNSRSTIFSFEIARNF